MRAVVITSRGEVDGIGISEVDDLPAPTGTEIRVRVHAAGLNRADLMQRRGKYPAPAGNPENIPGLEFAGEVEAVGDAVGQWKIGDRVFGITAGGAQAEFVVVPESNLARIPDELEWSKPVRCRKCSSLRMTRSSPLDAKTRNDYGQRPAGPINRRQSGSDAPFR